MASDTIKIERHVSISHPAGGAPWVLRDVRVVSGTEFIELRRGDHDFTQYLTSKRAYNKQVSVLITSLIELQVKASAVALGGDDESGGKSVYKTKQQMKALKTLQQGIPKDSLADVVLESFPCEGERVAAVSTKMPVNVQSQTAMVELRPDVIHWLVKKFATIPKEAARSYTKRPLDESECDEGDEVDGGEPSASVGVKGKALKKRTLGKNKNVGD